MRFTGILGVVKFYQTLVKFYHFYSGRLVSGNLGARGKQNVKSEVNRGLKTSIV